MPSIPIVDDAFSDFLARWRNHLKTAHEFGRVNAAQDVTTLLEFLTVAQVEATLTAALSVSGETIQQIIQSPRPPELRTNPVVALRRFFDFAILEGLISTSPMPDTKGTGPGGKTGFATADIEDFLDKAADIAGFHHRKTKSVAVNGHTSLLIGVRHRNQQNSFKS